MPRVALFLAVGLIVGGLLPSTARSEDLPEDAARLVAAFEEDAEAIRQEAEAKVARQRKELAAKLKELQDAYCKAAKLDDAVAIRDKIRLLGEGNVRAAADPGNLTSFAAQTGAKFHFTITGSTTGHGYGTDVYTTDSSLATMAVHAGVVKSGETAVVRVTILPGRNNYLSSTRNGITTTEWSQYPSSYSIERVRDVEAATKVPAPFERLPAPFGEGNEKPVAPKADVRRGEKRGGFDEAPALHKSPR